MGEGVSISYLNLYRAMEECCMSYCVRDVLQALDKLSGGRCVMNQEDLAVGGGKPHVITKTSNIFGKAVTETPGLVWGNPEMIVKKIAVMMTLTVSAIELAAATGVNVIVAHHPYCRRS
jgi:hypothetical protein